MNCDVRGTKMIFMIQAPGNVPGPRPYVEDHTRCMFHVNTLKIIQPLWCALWVIQATFRRGTAGCDRDALAAPRTVAAADAHRQRLARPTTSGTCTPAPASSRKRTGVVSTRCPGRRSHLI